MFVCVKIPEWTIKSGRRILEFSKKSRKSAEKEKSEEKSEILDQRLPKSYGNNGLNFFNWIEKTTVSF
jgi:hypothetical protein